MVAVLVSMYSSFFMFRFDEMHYGKYAAMYLKNTFFFDANPPLGKMLVALAGYVAGFDGKRIEFVRISVDIFRLSLIILIFLPAYR